MLALETFIDRLRTARLAVRAVSFLKELGPYAAIELLVPGGSLIAIGLWLYARRKAGKPLLPWKRSSALFSRPAIEGLFTSRSEAASQP